MTPQTTIQETVDRVLAERRHLAGALLPVLHGVQEALGYVPSEAVPQIADGLNLSRAEVHGVISFYHHFRDTVPGRHTVYLCRAESCQAMQGRALEAHAKNALGIDFLQTTADGAVTLEPIYCLGNCALSPAVMVDGHVHGRVTPQRFDALMAEPSGRRVAPTHHSKPSQRRVYVPRDSGALSMGAEDVAAAVAARLPPDMTLVRNGSRGLYWLEPLVEVETSEGRIAYGPVAPDDLESLFAADVLAGGAHPLRLGVTDQIPYLAKQERLTCARVGVIDPVSLDDYRAHGGFAGLERALAMVPAAIVQDVTDS